jgi:catechol 2,3-dioxygenase-like lactoylglutathione lyase family enzyme
MAADDGNLIELLYFHSHRKGASKKKKIYDVGISHIAFTVKDVDKAYKRLLKVGIKFNSPPQVSPDGYAKVAFLRDYDGCLIELVEVL